MQQYSDKHKHLDFLQGAINRMSGNLFLLKGWTVTLIAALFALAAKDSNLIYAALAYFPLLTFWTLDGYFLAQERCFRALYDHVRTLDEKQMDHKNTWAGAMLSRTLVVYYVSLALILLALIAIAGHVK